MSKVFYFLWIRHYYFLLYRLLAMWNIYKCVYNVQKIMNLNEINVHVFLTLRYFEFYIFSYFNFGAAGIKCKHTCSLTFQICCQLHNEKKMVKILSIILYIINILMDFMFNSFINTLSLTWQIKRYF